MSFSQKKKLPTWKQLQKTQQGTADELYEMENHFILRLPLDAAERVNKILSENEGERLGNRLAIKFEPDMRHAVVKLDGRKINGKLLDLPCTLEIQKTLDRKNFYKVADMSQMLYCSFDFGTDEDKQKEEQLMNSKKRDKMFLHPHGVTQPLKNVRKRRFRKTLKKKCSDMPELERELKRLLRADLDAVKVRWEVISTEQTEPPSSAENATTSTAPEPSATTILSSGTVSAQKASAAAKKPPEFCFSSEALGGGASSSEDEGGEMARQLMASIPAVMAPENDPALKVLEQELWELSKRRLDLQTQIKTIDNLVLKERMGEEIKDCLAKEEAKRNQLSALKEKPVTSSSGEK